MLVELFINDYHFINSPFYIFAFYFIIVIRIEFLKHIKSVMTYAMLILIYNYEIKIIFV